MLYLYINKYSRYPIGPPKILVGSELDGRNFSSLSNKSRYSSTEVIISLGVKMHNKLVFDLYFKCTKELNTGECEHSSDERVIHGTYVADELRLAVRKVYVIRKIYGAWDYRSTQYCKTTKNGGIFAKYIDTFLKNKDRRIGVSTTLQFR